MLDVALGGGIVAVLVAIAAGIRQVVNGRRAAPAAPLAAARPNYEKRLDELDDRYNHLTRRFDRLQGEFNAINRLQTEDEEFEEDT